MEPLSVSHASPSLVPHVNREKNPYKLWIHNHPTCVKTSYAFLSLIGFYMLSSSMINFSFTLNPIVKGIGGFALLRISSYASKVLHTVCPLTHPAKSHVYTPAECDGGNLKYEGNIPVLTLTTTDPQQAGFAHGWLLAQKIDELLKAYKSVYNIPSNVPLHGNLWNFIEKVKEKIPNHYLTELQGLVNGYAARTKKLRLTKAEPLTFEEALFLNILPDAADMNLLEMENWARRTTTFGCTVVIGGSKDTGPIFGRNLDSNMSALWGKYTLIVKRPNTVEVTFPCILGTLTGMNQNRLCVAMNSSSGSTSFVDGTPTLFYVRECLETCEDFNAATKFVNANPALSPFHLCVADADKAATFHFNQSRNLYGRQWNSTDPLVTTNFRYGLLGQSHPLSDCWERETVLQQYFNNSYATVANALKREPVNKIKTIHSIMMDPRRERLQVAFDNGWAANQPLMEVDLTSLFD